jgi:hypothetical protein
VSGLQNQAMYTGQPVASQLVVVEAVDEHGNRATGYDGTVTFDGGDYPTYEVLPADSTLTNGRGVFAVNVGSLQNDCHYGDIQPRCDGYWRVTASDTVDPSITGYQRVTTILYLLNLPSIFITPEGGVCDTCVSDPSDSLVIDLNQPVVLKNVSSTAVGQFEGTMEGVTVTGGTFTASVSGTSLVGEVGGNLNVMVPISTITTDLTVRNLDSLESEFGSVQVEVPYVNPNTGETQATNAYTTLFNFQGVICATGQCW